MADYLTKRHGIWHFVRKVPKRYRELDPRGIVNLTTDIPFLQDRNGRRAARKADRMNADLEAFWRKLAAGEVDEAKATYDEARRRARMLGFDYIELTDLAQGPTNEILRRTDRLAEGNLIEDDVAGVALLGIAGKATFLLSEVFEEFKRIIRTEIMGYSEDQLRVWSNAKKAAINGLIAVVGDKRIDQLTHDDAVSYADSLKDRVVDEEIVAKTANKTMGHNSRMLKEISKHHNLRLPEIFAGQRLGGEVDRQRLPYTTEFIVERILAPGALDGLNDQARDIILIVMGTGARPSEIANLNDKTILLAANIPHISIKPDGRRLKTQQSERDIPLVGLALDAARRHPNGFPRYADNASSFSAAANKFLQENGLRPTKDHSVYSLRHSFKDRLMAAGAQDSMIDVLMGHKEDGPKYGLGPALDLKLEFIQRVALTQAPVLPLRATA